MTKAEQIEAPTSPSLRDYATIRAALADDVPLDLALSPHKLRPRAFRKADRTWKKCLTEDAELFERFRRELEQAEDRRTRPVQPIDDDPGAWVAFLHAVEVDAKVVGEVGLRPSDLSRLARKWSRRLETDAELGKQLASLSEHPGTLPAITVGEIERKIAASEAPSPSGEVSSAPDDAGGVGLDGYASLSAELLLFPEEADRIWKKHGFPERAARASVSAAWSAAIAADAETAQAFRQLVSHYRGQFARRGKAHVEDAPAPAPEVAPPLHRPPERSLLKLQATAFLRESARGPALPFAEQAAAAMLPRREPREPKIATGTALALEGRPAMPLPFVGAQKPSPSEAKGPPKLAVTAPTFEAPKAFSLPFSPGEAARPAAKTIPKSEHNPSEKSLGRTAALPEQSREGAAPLPFSAPKESLPKIERPSEKAKRFAETSMGFVIPKNLPPPKQAAKSAETKAPEAPPQLRLEQHASLCVELALGGDRATTLARYRVSEAQLASLERHYGEARKRDPGAGAQWDRAYETYKAWMIAQRR